MRLSLVPHSLEDPDITGEGRMAVPGEFPTADETTLEAIDIS